MRAPGETAEEKAERQARLSQAMGRLFLTDRVAKMEAEANTLEFQRTPAGRSSKTGASMSAKGKGRGQSQQQQSLSVRVIDASLLIYALRTLHEWIKEGRYMLVIPLEALNVLDVLKKGEAPINVAARKATRFLDERITSHAPSPAGRAGLVAQNEAETVPWADIVSFVERAATKTARETAQAMAASLLDEPLGRASSDSRRSADSHGSAGNRAQSQAPLHIKGMLGCMAWHEQRLLGKHHGSSSADMSDDRDLVALAVAFPPEGQGSDEMMQGSQRFNSRADGRVTKQWADSVGMNIVVAPTAASWQQLGAPVQQAGGHPRSRQGTGAPSTRGAPTQIIFSK